jgi:hypothetical protein
VRKAGSTSFAIYGKSVLSIALWGLSLFCLPQAATGLALAQETAQAKVIELRTGQQTGAPLKVRAARNEYLSLTFQISGADPASLQVLTPKTGKIAYKVYQAAPAPLSSAASSADALIPLEQGAIPARSLQIWATFKVPPDLAKGVYSHDLVFQDHNGTFRQPVELQVWNFVLPEDLPITIMGNLWGERDWFARYGVKTEAQYNTVLKDYLRSMREYKFNALGPFLFPRIKGGEDFSKYDQILDYALNHLKYQYFLLPMARINKQNLGQTKDRFLQETQEYYPRILEYLRRHRWENRAINQVVDEPLQPYYPAVYELYARSKELAPPVKTLCTGKEPDPRLAKVINIWALTPRFFDPAKAAAAKGQGQEIWLYANRLHTLNHPRTEPRLIGWFLYQYQFSGYYFWGVNDWRQDPWTVESGKIDRWRRGSFYYPQSRTGAPLASTRLEALRQGFQDYQYLVLLDQARARGKVPLAAYEAVRQRVASLTRDFHPWMPLGLARITMTELEGARQQIGELLDKASLSN